jgi:hypothetical protein
VIQLAVDYEAIDRVRGFRLHHRHGDVLAVYVRARDDLHARTLRDARDLRR